MSSIDDEMRAHFDDLRAEDKSHAPEFSALLSDAARQVNEVRPRTRAVWWLAAAASVIVAATLVVQRARRGDVTPGVTLNDTIPSSSITSWTSPTGGLLRTSQQTTLTSPSIRRSVLDGVVAPPAEPNSSKRGGL